MEKSKLAKSLRVLYSLKSGIPIDEIEFKSDIEIIQHFTKCNCGGCQYSYLINEPELLEHIIEISDSYNDFLDYSFETIKDHYFTHEENLEENLEQKSEEKLE